MYPFREIEQKWQAYWEQNKIFHTPDFSDKPKYFAIDMFPYPSGERLHVGHPEGQIATDIICRYKRMQGFAVMHALGWDAFGLPAERYAMISNVHPSITTEQNITTYKLQEQSLGLSYDWLREINTTDPKYYKWTQWIFLKIYNSWYDHRENKARPIDSLIAELELHGTEQLAVLNVTRSVTSSEWKAMTAKQQHDVLADFRLVYMAEIPVNWCAGLGTVLANEEVDEWTGKGYTVERIPMRQWMMRITAYADRLLRDLDLLDWPHSTREMQRNWIGRSEGAEIRFELPKGKGAITVFTTRPDTIFGATYMVLAPEHPLVDAVATKEQKPLITEYRTQATRKSELERTALEKEKTGVFTGGYATNPATGEKIPIWIADYVLWGYGTGAIMAVPAHDERDFEFAQKFGLPIRSVVLPPQEWCERMVKNPNITEDVEDMTQYEKQMLVSRDNGGNSGLTFAQITQDFYRKHPEDFAEAYTEDGDGINSSNENVSLNGLATAQAKGTIIEWVEKNGIGRKRIQFKLRDWLFSRQRYWGEPIPILHLEDGTMKALDESELPLLLPDLEKFKPSGTTESPLALATEWVHTIDSKTGKPARRETNTMPQWAGSCWYYMRYLDPHNDAAFCDPAKEKYWMPVDLYIGGAEHAVLHLLYVRFWHKVLYDLGYVSTVEPFQKLVHQGMILGENSQKMSKSRGNVINPDDVLRDWGVDSFRLFEMFMGPLEMVKPWNTKGVEGVFRFLNRVWNMMVAEDGTLHANITDVPLTRDHERVLHQTIKKVGEDIEGLRFNTAISQMMIFVNEFASAEIKPREAMEKFTLVLSPFAPHLAEELWAKLGHSGTLASEPFPGYDVNKAKDDVIELVVQVNGKLRGKMDVVPDMPEKTLIENALRDETVLKFIGSQSIVKTIFVKNKLINFVVK